MTLQIGAVGARGGRLSALARAAARFRELCRTRAVEGLILEQTLWEHRRAEQRAGRRSSLAREWER